MGEHRFLLRVPPGLWERVVAAAGSSRRSLNAELVFRLEESFGPWRMRPVDSAALAERESGEAKAKPSVSAVGAGDTPASRSVSAVRRSMCEHRRPPDLFCKHCD